MPRRYSMNEQSRESLRRERTADGKRFVSSGPRKKDTDRKRLQTLLERCLAELSVPGSSGIPVDEDLLADPGLEIKRLKTETERKAG